MGAFDKYEDTGDGDFAASWSPADEGDVLEGKIKSVTERETKYGPRVVITFEPARHGTGSDPSEMVDGPFEWWLKPANSAGRPSQPLVAMRDAGMDVGKWARIELTELRDTGMGNPMKVYEVTEAEAPGSGLWD